MQRGEEETPEAQKHGMMPRIRRIHSNLGHPPKGVLERMLRDAGAVPLALECLQELDCELCRGRLRPKVPRPSAVPITGRRHGQVVSIDCFEIKSET